LLFALARDARVNVDVHPGIEGNITLNALNQTLPQLLTRIAKQVDMRYELDGPNLVVMPDSPFLRNYKVDYLNMSRDATSNVSIATQIATTGTGTGAAGGSTGNNNSTTSVTTNPTTASGTPWCKTSRISCGKPTKSFPKVLPKPPRNRPATRALRHGGRGGEAG